MDIVLFPLSFLIVIGLMPFIIKYFQEKQLGQMTREEGPSWHNSKSGTPTMGGVAFILANLLTIVLASLLKININTDTWLLTIVFILYGMIGFVDDFIKLIMKRNLGLTSKQKFLAQVVIGIVFYIVLLVIGFENQLNIFFVEKMPLSLLYGIFATFWLVGFSNATNLTDGIDGLMAVTGMIAYSTYAYIAFIQNRLGIFAFAISVVGGLLGFFIFNKKPAKIFMGDVGSLALGAGLAAMSIMLNIEWTLLFIGIIFVIETASVILQVVYFQKTGKRIFRMSPIHHHFEMVGWSEWKIVIVFGLLGVIGSAVTLLLL